MKTDWMTPVKIDKERIGKKIVKIRRIHMYDEITGKKIGYITLLQSPTGNQSIDIVTIPKVEVSKSTVERIQQ